MKNTFRLFAMAAAAAAFLLLSGHEAGAQSTNASSGPSLVAIRWIANASSYADDKHRLGLGDRMEDKTIPRFGLGSRITVYIEGAASAIQRAIDDSRKLILLMDEVPLRGLCTNGPTGGVDTRLITNTTFSTKRTVVTNGTAPNQTVTTNETITTDVVVITNLTARLQFMLERKDVNKADWATLLGSPRHLERPVEIEIGTETNNSISILSSNRFRGRLVVLPNEPFYAIGSRKWYGVLVASIIIVFLLVNWAFKQGSAAALRKKQWAWLACVVVALIAIYCCAGPTWCWLVFFIFFLAGFIFLAVSKEMIRDTGPNPPPPQQRKIISNSGSPPQTHLRPYSLARTQMAIWFFLSISAFVFIWLTTNALDTITGTVLALMGIGAGTALGAEAQDKGKINQLRVEKRALEEKKSRTADEERRLKRLNLMTADAASLQLEKEKLEGDLAVKDNQPEQFNGQLATEAVAMLNQEKTTLDNLGAGISQDQNQRLAKITGLLALGTEKDGLRASLKKGDPIPVRIKEIDAILAIEPEAAIRGRIKEIDNFLDTLRSHGFFMDILTDDDSGISFHRFQLFVWTLVLGLIFIASVYKRLAMPEFNETLLALMGVSSGTYMGFMIAEPKK